MKIIDKLKCGKDLTQNEINDFFFGVNTDKVSEQTIKDFLLLMAQKGETFVEINAVVNYINENAIKIGPFSGALDVHGTGGDGSGSFNISTTTIFILAAAGITIAKHGNRSSSSASGSADLLEALGVNIQIEPNKVEECIKKIGIGFMFAPNFHPKLKKFHKPRKELGIKTIFNKSFPMVSPAGVKNHFLGVTDWDLLPLYSSTLKKLKCKSFMLVHGRDPMDEISISSPTDIYFYSKGKSKNWLFKPDDFGIKKTSLNLIKGGNAFANAIIAKNILSNKEKGPKRDIVLLNSAASFLIMNKVKNWQAGIELAKQTIESGSAIKKLEELISFTNA